MNKVRLQDLPPATALAELRRRGARKRWKRLDNLMKKEYGSARMDSAIAAELGQKVMVELALFGEDEKIRLLAAQNIKAAGGGRALDDKDGVLEKIRQDLAGSP